VPRCVTWPKAKQKPSVGEGVTSLRTLWNPAVSGHDSNRFREKFHSNFETAMSKKPPKKFACIRIVPIRKWDHGTYGVKGMAGRKTGLAGYLAHDFRFMNTPNADMNLIGTNMVFCKKTKWQRIAATHENLRRIGIKSEFSVPYRAEKMLRRLKVPVQKNSIVATALMLTVSPEHFRDGNLENKVNDEKLEKYINGTMKFLRKRFGNRLLLVCLHMDEMNPHISAYILPLIKKEMKKEGRPKKGEEHRKREIRVETRLGHTEMFTRDKLILEKTDNPAIQIIKEVIPGTCSILQDEYTDSLNDEGLDVMRGAKHEPGQPRLKHVSAKKQYERMIRGMKGAEEEIAKLKDLSRKEIEELLRQAIAVATEADNLRIQRDHYQNLAAAKDERISRLEKNIADSMRELSVAEVIEAVTGIQPLHHKSNGNPLVRHGSNKVKKINIETEFHLPNGQRIGVDNAKNSFENLTPEIPFRGEGAKRQTGTGSINAVMYLTGSTYDSAMARLAAIFGNESVQRAVVKKTDLEIDDKKNTLLVPDESHWPELLVKLKAMNIREDVVELARASTGITANCDGHILFRKKTWDEKGNEKPSGTVVVDPHFPEATVMETGGDDTFMLMDSGMDEHGRMIDPRMKHVVVCATPMEALAIKSLKEHRKANVMAIGRNPGQVARQTVKFMADIHPGRMYFADNLLAHGRHVAAWLAEHFSAIIQKLPLPVNFRTWTGLQTAPETTVPPNPEPLATSPNTKDQSEEPTME
jgi:Plasmid recombination enzyme